jgi:hypothetical protein
MSPVTSTLQAEVFAMYPRVKAIIEQASGDDVTAERRTELQRELREVMVSATGIKSLLLLADHVNRNRDLC